MLPVIAIAVAVALLAYILFIRDQDLPEAVPELPYRHLEDRKRTIYENLRDLQFEYRVGKLSDDDYQRTKQELQAELAGVLAGIDEMKQKMAPAARPVKAAPAPAKAVRTKPGFAVDCPHCGAHFDRPLKFCGECGKPLEQVSA